jgi:ATP-dependent Lhr-like helicase
VELFHPIIAEWFRERFGEPTEPQRRGWPAIAAGQDTLIAAPTGSGKTLAAFLTAINAAFREAVEGRLTDETHILYISPLKALANDVHKNLELPLGEICKRAFESGLLIPEIRAAVRSGDTLAAQRQAILRRPPHILVTTPESLYLLLTAERSRRMLRAVRTVILDEIHAVAPNKRGSHLSLSLARLDALVAEAGHRRPVRIGLSATVRPLEEMGSFLVGAGGADVADFPQHSPKHGRQVRIIAIGGPRELDLGVETPSSELGPIATNEQWEQRFDRLAALAAEHRSTLVFVSTRALAERIAHRMRERLGDDAVAAHHGSLARRIRLRAEERFKRGELRMMVATASLELGLDIGTVDLVCQIGSPRALSTAWQRIGRAGHWKSGTPKGRFFALTLDDLVECAAVVRALRQGELDELTIPPWPRDVLAQQMIATVATGEWGEEELFGLVRQAWPYRDLPRAEFDAILQILSEGISHRRGRSSAWLHRDGVHRRLRPRRGARLAALTNGGAIAENFNYTVVAEPDQMAVGTVDEDFAVESNAGDVILLGTTSWIVRGVESSGRMRVENAHGAPPTVPFWRGEAPGRTPELSAAVGALRTDLIARLRNVEAGGDAIENAARWLRQECALDAVGAVQAALYLRSGVQALGAVPTPTHFVAERFFDEGGGMQLVIHAPLGSRINKAWGMALRKRFCRNFDFELQASGSENGLVLSLSEQHSFPLETIFQFLQAGTVEDILVQAILQSPLFGARWRWDAGRALALLRFAGGRKLPPGLQRLKAEDLLAAVFPLAVGCQDNHGGAEIPLPDHPYVQEAMRDCLHEPLDIVGLRRVLAALESGEISFSAVDTPAPSALSHEILNAAPYSYLDDAPLEERRTRAVNLRRSGDPASAGALDAAAIAAVVAEAWPEAATADEVHDALLSLYWLPDDEVPAGWLVWLDALRADGRALRVATAESGAGRMRGWIATERAAVAAAAGLTAEEKGEDAITGAGEATVAWNGVCQAAPLPAPQQDGSLPAETAMLGIVRGWTEAVGPTTGAALARRLGFATERDVAAVVAALFQLEGDGQVLRGYFLTAAPQPGAAGSRSAPADAEIEWCDRRLLARIHRRTLHRLRGEIEPVAPAVFLRFLMRWQHVEPDTRLHGSQGLLAVLAQMQGYEAASVAWEQALLRTRVADYSPEMLDLLCLSGEIAWARLSPPAAVAAAGARRVVPTRAAPITFFRRADAAWVLPASGWDPIEPRRRLTPAAAQVLAQLECRGASFFADLVPAIGSRAHDGAGGPSAPALLKAQVEHALWELVAAGLVTADGFDNLRALLDRKRRQGEGSGRNARPRHSSGRWSLVAALAPEPLTAGVAAALISRDRGLDDSGMMAERRQALAETQARQLLRRYGVIFRALMERENVALSWFELLLACRRMEHRGELRGGRFVSGFQGEQYALPEAVEALRAARRLAPLAAPARISACDPLNVVGILVPGARVAAQPGAAIELSASAEAAGAAAFGPVGIGA